MRSLKTSNDPALDLAHWILSELPGITHVKLQKLCFYCYGYVTAVAQIEEVPFEAWQYGPVSRSIWERFKIFGTSPITAESTVNRNWSSEQSQVLCDVLTVYGGLSAWQLRELSCTEEPWANAYGSETLVIPDRAIREHFLQKTVPGAVELPEPLSNSWSLKLDNLPVPRFASFHEAASAWRSLSEPTGDVATRGYPR